MNLGHETRLQFMPVIFENRITQRGHKRNSPIINRYRVAGEINHSHRETDMMRTQSVKFRELFIRNKITEFALTTRDIPQITIFFQGIHPPHIMHVFLTCTISLKIAFKIIGHVSFPQKTIIHPDLPLQRIHANPTDHPILFLASSLTTDLPQKFSGNIKQ